MKLKLFIPTTSIAGGLFMLKRTKKSGLQEIPETRSINVKATPRFELGVKDLQSSALPLGHVAVSNE